MDATTEEKWQWINDLAKRRTPSTEFDDDNDRQNQVRGAIANGWQWMRAEERIGRWLGLALAILVWGTFAVCYFQAHPIDNTTSIPAGECQEYQDYLDRVAE
jgi:hypothetical protein